jgi:hypothetical protein
VLVACAAQCYEVFKPFLGVVRVGAMVYVQRSVVAATQAAAVPVSTVYLPLEHRPLLRLPALRVRLPTILGED